MVSWVGLSAGLTSRWMFMELGEKGLGAHTWREDWGTHEESLGRQAQRTQSPTLSSSEPPPRLLLPSQDLQSSVEFYFSNNSSAQQWPQSQWLHFILVGGGFRDQIISGFPVGLISWTSFDWLVRSIRSSVFKRAIGCLQISVGKNGIGIF